MTARESFTIRGTGRSCAKVGTTAKIALLIEKTFAHIFIVEMFEKSEKMGVLVYCLRERPDNGRCVLVHNVACELNKASIFKKFLLRYDVTHFLVGIFYFLCPRQERYIISIRAGVWSESKSCKQTC